MRICLLAAFLAFQPLHAQSPDIQAQMEAFTQIRNQAVLAKTDAEHWDAIVRLESFLTRHPDTFLTTDVRKFLLNAYGNVVGDPVLLQGLVSKIATAGSMPSGLHRQIADIYLRHDILPDRAVSHAEDAVRLALEMDSRTPQYRLGIAMALRTLARSYHAADRPGLAVSTMDTALAETRRYTSTLDDLSESATRLDTVRIEKLALLSDQRIWDQAYTLASDLLVTTKLRSSIYRHWSAAYIGKYGSGAGIDTAYRDLMKRRVLHRSAELEHQLDEPAPELALESVDGRELTWEGLRGKTVVLSFWAGWCGPCLNELAALDRINQSAHKRDLEIIAINIEQGSDVGRKRMIENQMMVKAPSLTFALGSPEVQTRFGSQKLPFSCVVDPQGTVRYRNYGFEWDDEKRLADQIRLASGK